LKIQRKKGTSREKTKQPRPADNLDVPERREKCTEREGQAAYAV